MYFNCPLNFKYITNRFWISKIQSAISVGFRASYSYYLHVSALGQDFAILPMVVYYNYFTIYTSNMLFHTIYTSNILFITIYTSNMLFHTIYTSNVLLYAIYTNNILFYAIYTSNILFYAIYTNNMLCYIR